jgi:hypothetical protein
MTASLESGKQTMPPSMRFAFANKIAGCDSNGDNLYDHDFRLRQ